MSVIPLIPRFSCTHTTSMQVLAYFSEIMVFCGKIMVCLFFFDIRLILT